MNRAVLMCGLALFGAMSAWAEPRMDAEFIFPQQEKHVHSSCVVECPNGDLLACWFYGSGERRASDVLVQGARKPKGAKEWSPVFLMADTPEFPDCNPVLFIDAKKRLWMFWIVVPSEGWQHSILKYRRAEKYSGPGAPKWSWQDIIILKPGEEFAETMEQKFEELNVHEGMWAEYALPYSRMLLEAAQDREKREKGWMTRTNPVVLPSGRILLPLYSDGFNASLVAISDDLGENWRASKPMIGLGPIQPTIARKKDGTLVSYMRDSGGAPMRALTATSNDDGESWSAAVDTDLPNPGSSLVVRALADGRWAMIYNDSEVSRNTIVIALSDDEGASWKWKRHLDQAAGREGGFAYPSLVQAKDGTLHVSYSYKTDAGATIKHVALNEEWIEQGD